MFVRITLPTNEYVAVTLVGAPVYVIVQEHGPASTSGHTAPVPRWPAPTLLQLVPWEGMQAPENVAWIVPETVNVCVTDRLEVKTMVPDSVTPEPSSVSVQSPQEIAPVGSQDPVSFQVPTTSPPQGVVPSQAAEVLESASSGEPPSGNELTEALPLGDGAPPEPPPPSVG